MSKTSVKTTCERPKPVMRHMHHNMMMRNVAVALLSCGLAALTFNIVHTKRRARKYKHFYENYDAERSFNRMRNGGYLSSSPPDQPEDEKKQKKA